MAAPRLTRLAGAAIIVAALAGAVDTQARAVPAPANNSTTFNQTVDVTTSMTESVLPLVVLVLAAYAILAAAEVL